MTTPAQTKHQTSNNHNANEVLNFVSLQIDQNIILAHETHKLIHKINGFIAYKTREPCQITPSGYSLFENFTVELSRIIILKN